MQILIKSLQKQVVENFLSRFIDIDLLFSLAINLLNTVFFLDKIVLFSRRTPVFAGVGALVVFFTAVILYGHHVELKLLSILVPTSMLPFFRRRILKNNVIKLHLKLVIQQRILQSLTRRCYVWIAFDDLDVEVQLFGHTCDIVDSL